MMERLTEQEEAAMQLRGWEVVQMTGGRMVYLWVSGASLKERPVVQAHEGDAKWHADLREVREELRRRTAETPLQHLLEDFQTRDFERAKGPHGRTMPVDWLETRERQVLDVLNVRNLILVHSPMNQQDFAQLIDDKGQVISTGEWLSLGSGEWAWKLSVVVGRPEEASTAQI